MGNITFIHICFIPQRIWAFCVTLLKWWVITLCPWSNSILLKWYVCWAGRIGTNFSSLLMVPAWAWQSLENSCKHTKQTLSCDQPEKTEASAHDTDWHHSLHLWPKLGWIEHLRGKDCGEAPLASTAALYPPCHMAWLLCQGVPWSLSGFHPDYRIFTKGLSVLGIVHSKPKPRQHSLKLLSWGYVGKYNLRRFVCLV